MLPGFLTEYPRYSKRRRFQTTYDRSTQRPGTNTTIKEGTKLTDFLEKYKPNIDLTQAFIFDDSQPDEELSFELNKKIQIARKLQDFTFLALGKMLKTFRDRKLYKQLDFENFSQYLASEDLSFSREKAYVYIRIYEIFVERLHLNQDELSKLGVVRLMTLAPVIRGIEDDQQAIQKVEEAKALRYNDFIRQIKQETSKDGKPTMYWSEEAQKWIVNYYEDITALVTLGKWSDREITPEES